MLEADGALDAIELTGGSSLENPMYLFRGEAPIDEMATSFPQPIRLGVQAASAERSCKRTRSRRRTSCPTRASSARRYACRSCCSAASTARDTIERALGEGFEFVAMGRALLREPDLVNRLASGAATRVALRPLQQVHADDLPRHPLRARVAPTAC